MPFCSPRHRSMASVGSPADSMPCRLPGIGAIPYMTNYNVTLDTADVALGRAIAAELRATAPGGLPGESRPRASSTLPSVTGVSQPLPYGAPITWLLLMMHCLETGWPHMYHLSVLRVSFPIHQLPSPESHLRYSLSIVTLCPVIGRPKIHMHLSIFPKS